MEHTTESQIEYVGIRRGSFIATKNIVREFDNTDEMYSYMLEKDLVYKEESTEVFGEEINYKEVI